MNNFPYSLIFVVRACKYVHVYVQVPTRVHASVCVHACKGQRTTWLPLRTAIYLVWGGGRISH